MRSMKQILGGLLFLVIVCSGLARADDAALEIIPLKHRPAEEIIPIIRPFVHEQGTLTGTGFQLIVRTTSQNLEELKTIIERLDTAPRRLLITVKQDVSAYERETAAELSGAATVDGESRVTVGGPKGAGDGEDGLRARVLSTRSRDDDTLTQRVQVLEGREAYIEIGRSIPLPARSVVHTPGGINTYDSIEYRDVTVGFYVLPRLSGENVTLEINPHRDLESGHGGGQISIQQIQTTVTGRIGEWLDIGGAVQEQVDSGAGTVYSTRERAEERRRVFIKVEELP